MSSNRRSSKDMEDTDDMMIESLPKNDKDNEYTLSDSDEDETDERLNRYEYDNFVVPDSYEDGTEGMEGTDTESKQRRRRKRKNKDYSLDKDDTDLLEENLGTSTDRYRRLKKARKTDTEDDDNVDDEDASLSSSYQRERRYQTFDDLKLINQIFHQNTENEDADRMIMDDDNDLMNDRRNDLKGYFNPEEIQERYQTDQDRIIIEKDEPERLQLRFKNRPMPDNPELIEETNWLVEKIMMKNSITSKDTVNLKNKVHKVLEFLRLAGCEIMYIWTHKKNEVTSDKRSDIEKQEYDLKLSDLWYIYELDLEWMQIYQTRKHISALIGRLENLSPVSNNVRNSFRSCYDLILLDYYLKYAEYQLRKYVDDQEIYQMLTQDNQDYEIREPKFKRMKKRNFAREVMKYNLHEVASQIAISPDQMADNLMANEQIIRPKIINDTPVKIANEYSNAQVQMISAPVSTLTTLCEFMSLELFYHPIIRKMVKKLYYDKVMIYTNPTEKGNKEITVYNFYYPTKRIIGKKPADFGSDLWLMMLEAEKKGLIEISFKLPWENSDKKNESKIDKQESNDEIRTRLLSFYQLEVKTRKGESEEMDTINAWNIVRDETITKLLKMYLYPSLKIELREELRAISEKFIITDCGKSFKESINIQPYKKTTENGDAETEQSRLQVLSCISVPASAQCYFVVVDENGELMEHIVLDHIGRNPGDDLSLKIIYNHEREQLKNFMFKTYPDVIVVGATNLNCQQIKVELNNIAAEVLTELQEKIPNCNASKPFVMWGINSVPSAWAKTYQACKKYGELPQEIREALSHARNVQNPLAETLNLWSDRIKDNALLCMNYHVMQH